MQEITPSKPRVIKERRIIVTPFCRPYRHRVPSKMNGGRTSSGYPFRIGMSGKMPRLSAPPTLEDLPGSARTAE
jgi:hypothetical protein